MFATTLRGTPGRPSRVASKAVVGRLAVLCRMLPGSEYLLLRCRVQGVGVVNVGYMVTEKEKGERERERRVSEKERGCIHTGKREREGIGVQKERGGGAGGEGAGGWHPRE